MQLHSWNITLGTNTEPKLKVARVSLCDTRELTKLR